MGGCVARPGVRSCTATGTSICVACRLRCLEAPLAACFGLALLGQPLLACVLCLERLQGLPRGEELVGGHGELLVENGLRKEWAGFGWVGGVGMLGGGGVLGADGWPGASVLPVEAWQP